MNSLYLNSKKSNILLYSKKPFGNSNIEQDIKFLIGFCEEDTFDKFLNLAKKLFEHGTITCSTYYNDGMVWNKTEETIRIEKLEKILKINLVV
jgi:lipid II:glycine glycyltransferase (peptidoglycan interpeptide bridge formation enzyme)